MIDKIIKMNKCVGCLSCQNICPVSAIQTYFDFEGFCFPRIDKSKCIHCEKCMEVCPANDREKKEENKINKPIACYSAYTKDDSIRYQSSSGGIFPELAKQIIAVGGVVFGAEYDKEFNVIYTWADKDEDLKKFSGSKYVQCYMGKSYKEIKIFLEQKRVVLISGTPCMISAIKSYLGKEYENLYSIDIVCHGVPAPGIWRFMLKSYNKEAIEDIKFRDKRFGWDNHDVHIYYKNKRVVKEKHYPHAYANSLFLRKNCYNCEYKGVKEDQSDITLGDAWGIDDITPNFSDGKGVSCVIVRTEKGVKLFNDIKREITFRNVIWKKMIKYNPMVNSSPMLHKERDNFYSALKKYNFKSVLRKYSKIK